MHAYLPNHYEALGVPRDADAEAIRQAWRQQAKELHPDLSDGETDAAFLRLQEAYNVLRDPERRAHYDATLARQAMAARRPIRPTKQQRAPAAPLQQRRRRRRLPSPFLGMGHYWAALGLVVTVAAGVVVWQLYFADEPEPVMIVKVDRDPHNRPQLPADPGILTREVDRAVQAQIDRVEAAKKRMNDQLSELDARKPQPKATAPAGTAPSGAAPSGAAPSGTAPSGSSASGAAPIMVAQRVQCIGRGTSIVMTRENDVALVSYDDGPKVQPRISDLSPGTVLVSRFEPTNRIAIGFTKGTANGTTLLMFDDAGRVLQTFNVECTAAAF